MPERKASARAKRKDVRPPQTGADEKSTLVGFLNYLREAIASKAEGAPEPQVRTPGVESGTSVLGLIKHLTCAEGFYFLGESVKNWEASMRPGPEETLEDLVAAYRKTVRRANEVIDSYTDLSLPAPTPPGKQPSSMRWLLVHMIEETGRHAGHADILREQIDNTTGR